MLILVALAAHGGADAEEVAGWLGLPVALVETPCDELEAPGASRSRAATEKQREKVQPSTRFGSVRLSLSRRMNVSGLPSRRPTLERTAPVDDARVPARAGR